MPLMFLLAVVMVDQTNVATKQLAAVFSNKWDQSYLATYGYVCARLSLNLLCALILIVQKSKSGRPHPIRRITEGGVEDSYLLYGGLRGLESCTSQM